MITEISNFYKTHTQKETLQTFHISQQTLYKQLEVDGIPHHSKEESIRLSKLRNRNSPPPRSDGKFGYNDGIKNYRLTPEEAKKFSVKLFKGFLPMDAETRKHKLKSAQETNLKLYGDKNYNNPLKQKETFKLKYGGNPMLREEVKNKRITTCLNKYGVENYSQTDEFHSKAKHIYIYNNNSFDSSYELALYIYALDHGEDIKRLPVRLSYIIDGNLHYYFPDFLYKNNLVEVKGSHLLNQDNKLSLPYKTATDEDKDRLVGKQKCMEENGVILLTYNEVKFAIDYVNKKYGKNYLSSFKTARLGSNT